MIINYTKPQDTITLLLEYTSQGVARRANPVIIGPSYLLARRGTETLYAKTWASPAPDDIRLNTIDDSGAAVPLPLTHVVDVADIRLWADNVLLAIDTTSGRLWNAVDGNPTKLRVASGISVAGTSFSLSDFKRELRVGDVLLCSDAYSSYRRRVTALLGRETDLEIGDLGVGAYNPAETVADVAVDGVFDSAELALSNEWSAKRNGNKTGTEAGEEFVITFGTVNPAGTPVTLVKTSSGAALSGTAVRTDDDPAEVWDVTVDDGTTDNTLVLTLTMPEAEALQTGDVTAVTIKSTYTPGDYTALALTGTGYTGLVNTRVVVEVLQGGATFTSAHQFRISDTRNRALPVTITEADMAAPSTGTYLGLSYSLPAAGYRTGDVFYFDITAPAASTTDFDGVILDGPAYDTALNPTGINIAGDAAEPFTGRIERSWCSDFDLVDNTLTFGTIAFEAGSLANLEAIPGYGTISASFRALLPVPADETWLTIRNSADILSYVGVIDIDNPAAYAASRAISGTQGSPVYVVRTAGVTAADYSDALKKISNTDLVYALNIVGTTDPEVFGVARTHCEEQSQPTRKNFRRVYVGVDSPGSYLRVGTNSQGDTAKARILPYAGSNRLLSFSTEEGDAEVDMVASGVRVGDIVKVYNGPVDDDGNATAVEYAIESLVEPEEGQTTTQALLVAGPAEPLQTDTATEVWAADTAENQIDYLVSVARSMSSRRTIVVWCENGTIISSNGLVRVPSQYIASEIAGLRCALLPQEGLTTYEVSSATSAPAMYTRYTEEQLNRAAANGVMIVTQEYPGGPVFVRHQLTTETDAGLLAWEDSVGVNLDDQGFQVKDAFASFRGRKNVTERTRQEAEDVLYQLVFNMTQAPLSQTIGQQITGFSDENGEVNKVTVRFHETFKDRLVSFYRPGMPVPLNGIDHTIYGEVQELI